MTPSGHNTAKQANNPPNGSSPFAALLEPFKKMAPEKQELLREVLQIYVSKDSGKSTDLEKRKRLTDIINHFAKDSDAEEGA